MPMRVVENPYSSEDRMTVSNYVLLSALWLMCLIDMFNLLYTTIKNQNFVNGYSLFTHLLENRNIKDFNKPLYG